MKIIYNIGIWLYILAIHLSSLFNFKAKKWIEGRKNIFKKLIQITKKNTDIVWFHCASLGEYEQGKPIIKAYKLKFPKHKILLTFFSPSGFETKKRSLLADWIFYLPADTKTNAKTFIKIINPIKVIFIKYEFWLNYITELNKKNIPFYSVSTVFRSEQIFFKFKWFGKKLNHVNHFFLQNKKSALLLENIGIKNYTITGDTRFDTVLANAKKEIIIPLLKRFIKNENTIVCGSTWPKDEKLLIQYIRNHPNKKYIIAPHELNNITYLKEQTNALLYSNANKTNILNNNVLIIDSIGMLSNIYKYGDVAYIGGGFDSGIHNILEAATFGLPVVFGPNYHKFNEAFDLINYNAAISISNYKELKSGIEMLTNYNKSTSIDYIKKNSGATRKILKLIN